MLEKKLEEICNKRVTIYNIIRNMKHKKMLKATICQTLLERYLWQILSWGISQETADFTTKKHYYKEQIN